VVAIKAPRQGFHVVSLSCLQVKSLESIGVSFHLTPSILQLLTRESQILMQLNHPNVQPFYGFCRRVPGLVSPYWASGTVQEFLIERPNLSRVARINLVRHCSIPSVLQWNHTHAVVISAPRSRRCHRLSPREAARSHPRRSSHCSLQFFPTP
jgi:hypothetical protein